MTKLLYIANVRLPTERAHGVQIMKMCEAFAREGTFVVELVLPRRRNHIPDDPFAYYGIPKLFTVRTRYASDVSMITLGTLGFWINQFSFSLVVALAMLFGKRGETVIFSRDEITGFLLSLLGYYVFYDMHGFPENKRMFWKIAMRRMTGIIGTNQWKLDQTKRQFGISEEKLLLARNGFDPQLFTVTENKEQLRKELALPLEKPIVLYSGHLYDWKGVFTLADTARMVPEANFIFIGGTAHEVVAFKERYADCPNIIVGGLQPLACVPRYLKAADVLVLPSSRKSSVARLAVFSEYDTSPIKLFEYMASGVPIVASDVPSSREIVDEESAVMAEPDQPESFALAVRKVLADPARAASIAKNAQTKAQEYTWEKRAGRIIGFIQQRRTL